jgi:hypothetical protein
MLGERGGRSGCSARNRSKNAKECVSACSIGRASVGGTATKRSASNVGRASVARARIERNARWRERWKPFDRSNDSHGREFPLNQPQAPATPVLRSAPSGTAGCNRLGPSAAAVTRHSMVRVFVGNFDQRTPKSEIERTTTVTRYARFCL